MSAVIAVSLALVLGQPLWQVGLRGETRMLADGGGDLGLTPDVVLEYGARSSVVQGSYDPDMLLREPRERGTFNVLHRGAAVASVVLGRDTRIAARGTLVSGAADQSWLATSSAAVPNSATRPSASALVESLDMSSSLSIAQPIGRHIVAGATGAFIMSGGVGTEAQLSLPRTKTARGEASASWIDRLDAFTLTVGGSRGWVSNGRLTTSLDGGLGWRHAFTAGSQRALSGEPVVRLGERPAPRYEVELTGGASSLGGDDGERHGLVPTASLTVRRDESAPRFGALSGRWTVRYAPVLDATAGTLTPRVEMSSTLDLRLARDLLGMLRSGVGWTIGATPPAPKLAQCGAGASFEPWRGVSFSAELRIARLPQTEWAAVITTSVLQRGRF